MITIIDYGLGNISAFSNVYERLNIPILIAKTADDLKEATKIILPGVGAFDHAMSKLNNSGMRETLEKLVLVHQIPVIGICVGMQMLANRSDEGVLAGLGWITGEVKRFDDSTFSQKRHLPHMGWNDVLPKGKYGLFKNLESEARFYFLHSYYFAPQSQDHVLAVTDYYGVFASIVRCDNVFGVQFHPEKSHQCGIQLLKNFAEI